MTRNHAGLFFAIALTGWACADPKLGVDVHKASDKVELRLSQDRPFENVTQKWRENPHRLEITIPKVEWQGKAVSNIDKGVLQKVEVKPGSGSVTVTLFALQNPKMSWASSSDKKNWTLRISVGELASGNDTPKLPVASTSTGFAALPPVKANPTGARPNPRPLANNSPPVRPAPSVPRNNIDQRIISVSFVNKDLPAAIREMASAAGLEADIAPGVKGSVTATFKDTPLSQALTNVLGKQQDLYEVKIEGNRVRVFGDNSGAGTTMVPTPAPPVPASDRGTRPLNLVSDYFPLMADKSAKELVGSIRRAFADVEIIHDDRLNVLFVRGEAGDLEKVRNLLQNVLAK